jgi:hypothetical protein
MSRNIILTYGAEPFLRRRQLCSPSRTSQHFMEPEVSIPCSQEPSTGPYPELYQSNPLHPISKTHFNIVNPPTSWSSQWSLSQEHNIYINTSFFNTNFILNPHGTETSFSSASSNNEETGPLVDSLSPHSSNSLFKTSYSAT